MKDLEILNNLHPAVACTLIIAVAAVLIVGVWQFWKTMRGEQ